MSDLSALAQDPNVIVNLITSALAHKGPYVTNPHQEPPVGTTSHLGRSAPTRLLATPSHVRLLSNALVEILAIKSRNPDLACGIRRHDSTAVLELILCSQTPLGDSIVEYVTHTWDHMAKLSTITASSTSTDTQRKQARLDLDCNTIGVVLPRLRCVFDEELVGLNKWKDQQLRWLAEKTRVNEDISHLAKCPAIFDDIAEKVTHCCEFMRDIPTWSLNLSDPARDKWTMLRNELAAVKGALNGPLKGENNFYEFEIEVCGRNNWLYNVLERLAQCLKYLFTLRQYASSKKTESRVMCGYSLTITRLDCLRPQYSIPWPSSMQIWEDMREKLHSDHRYTFIGDSSTHNPAMLEDNPSQLVLHPELTIFTYLNNVSLNNDGSSYPYNYISIAALACKACSLWIRAYNRKFRNVGFAINGSNNQWVPHWAMPDLEQGSQELLQEIIEVGLKIYFHFMEKFKHSKSLRPDPVDSDDERDREIALTDFYYYADY